jgi:hypothetical protein
MKAIWIVSVAAAFLAAPPLRSQVPVEPAVSTHPLTHDQLAIYQDFLSQYDNGQIGNLLGLQSVTVPFDIDKGLEPRDRHFIYGPGGCLHNIKLEAQSSTVHRLPPEIMQFGNPDSVLRRITAAGRLVPESKRRMRSAPDGFGVPQFTVSEIVFDVTGRYAVFTYAANCHCRGGEGASVLYERKNGKWKQVTYCRDSWEG